MACLRYVPPMGIYETLYAFRDAFGKYMGETGTHPWSQGFPRTVQLPGGPEIPTSVAVSSDNLKYPKAWGLPALREAVAAYYRTHYGTDITAENVMIFAGGRPGLAAVLLFLEPDIRVRIASTEYTPYFDLLRLLNRPYDTIASGPQNRFAPPVDELTRVEPGARHLLLLSNPCNPTGVTRHGDDLERIVTAARSGNMALLIDEAYELFHDEPVSALRYVRNIDETDI